MMTRRQVLRSLCAAALAAIAPVPVMGAALPARIKGPPLIYEESCPCCCCDDPIEPYKVTITPAQIKARTDGKLVYRENLLIDPDAPCPCCRGIPQIGDLYPCVDNGTFKTVSIEATQLDGKTFTVRWVGMGCQNEHPIKAIYLHDADFMVAVGE